jgi:hypothetical protein
MEELKSIFPDIEECVLMRMFTELFRETLSAILAANDNDSQLAVQYILSMDGGYGGAGGAGGGGRGGGQAGFSDYGGDYGDFGGYGRAYTAPKVGANCLHNSYPQPEPIPKTPRELYTEGKRAGASGDALTRFTEVLEQDVMLDAKSIWFVCPYLETDYFRGLKAVKRLVLACVNDRNFSKAKEYMNLLVSDYPCLAERG